MAGDNEPNVSSGVRHTHRGDEEITLIRSQVPLSPFRENTPSHPADGAESAGDGTAAAHPSPLEAAGQATSGSELLRRLALTNAAGEAEKAEGKPVPDGEGVGAAEAEAASPATGVTAQDSAGAAPFKTKVEHAGLPLTGRIISAAFCLPYRVGRSASGEWELNHRPGMAALFASFKHLASSATPWEHILVGWTGEVEETRLVRRAPSPGQGVDLTDPLSIPPPINSLSAPIPVEGIPSTQFSQAEHELHISKAARDALQEKLTTSKYGRLVPVWLSEASGASTRADDEVVLRDQSRWRRYADRVLYAALHYKADNAPTLDGASDTKFWQDYVRLNRQFAEQILAEYRAGDVVWIHDYQLFLLPGMLRAKVPNIYIGFYVHSPFPSSELIRCLSKRKDLLTGVLGANMIGFQSFSYSRHFTSCCTRILGFESNPAGIDAYGAHVAVDVFPIGIDVQHVQHMAFEDAETLRTVEEMRRIYRGKRIIVGRDRLDSVRGVTQKLMAFEMLLQQYPEWIGKVVLIQVTSPTSNDEEEAKLGTQLANLVASINGRFGSLSFSPVLHYPQYLASPEYFALLRIADVGLITSTRDGMNTTSLEYVVAQQGNHGPLILSEFSGTAANLSAAIHINPWSFSGTAAAINAALTMPAAARARQHAELYRLVTGNPITAWTDNFLDRLLTNLTSFDQSIATPALDPARLLHQYRRARRRLFMFDYDGTLTPIVKDPQAAIPSDRVLRTIKTLAADPRNAVWIISGRDQAFLDEWMGHISELGLSAEHGCFIRQPNSDDWENLTEQADMRWQDEVLDIFTHFTERTQGSFVERKRVALTWHHRRVDPEYAVFQAAECRRLLESTVATRWPVEVMVGKANLEVRPTFVNKGFIAQRLLDEYKRYHDGSGDSAGPDFVLCLGDDFTDEDMFRTLRACSLPPETIFSVTVGASSKQTIAKYHLLEPADVIATIAMLNQNAAAPAPELREALAEPKPVEPAEKKGDGAGKREGEPEKAEEGR